MPTTLPTDPTPDHVFKVFLPVIVAAMGVGATIFAAWSAKAQSRTNREKLKLDLFDRRFKIYVAVRDVLGHIETFDIQPAAIHAFRRATLEGEFVFGRELADFLGEICRRAFSLRRIQRRFDGQPTDAAVEKLNEEETEHAKWLDEQGKQLVERFRPYLDFSHVK